MASTLPKAGLISQTLVAVLLTSCAMFARNLLLLAIFGRDAIRFAFAPLIAMALVPAIFVWKRRHPSDDEHRMDLKSSSPVSTSKVLRFEAIFFVIQTLGVLGQRWLGTSGLLVVSILGGAVSSASTTAAAANLASHGGATTVQAGTAVVATSIVSTAMNLVIVYRQLKEPGLVRDLTIATMLQALTGVVMLLAELRMYRVICF